MGFLSNTKDKHLAKANDELLPILPDGEKIEKIFIASEDFCAIGDKRVFLIDKSFGTTKKTLTSVPYSKINFVSLKRGGFMKISKEVCIGTSSTVLEVDTVDIREAQEIVKLISSKI